jgi:hypothetical protein
MLHLNIWLGPGITSNYTKWRLRTSKRWERGCGGGGGDRGTWPRRGASMGRRRAVSLDSPLPPPHPPPHSRHKRYRHCRRFLERNMVTILLLVCAYEYFWCCCGCCVLLVAACRSPVLKCAASWCRCFTLFLYLFVFSCCYRCSLPVVDLQ